jgi:ureidoacrylate peracid hydrolase
VETPLSTLLDEANVDTLVICGFMTNFCCDSTAREAHDRDYFVDFVVDATGTPGTETLDENEIREVVSDLLGEGYARVVTTAELLHAL